MADAPESSTRVPPPRTWTGRVVQVLVVTALLGLLFSSLWTGRPELHTLTGRTMGTTYAIKIVAPSAKFDHNDLLAVEEYVQDRLGEINQLMSTYIPDSELSRLNRAPVNEPFALSEETFHVLQRALAISKQTGGAFDITVGPIVNAYGFGPDPRSVEPPDDAQLARLKERVGYHKLELDPASRTATRLHPNLYCDLSAIAKGYAVDQIAAILDDWTLKNYMVEIGGEVVARGMNLNGTPWQIAVEAPIPDERSVYRVLPLSERALATSGDYRNYYTVHGTRISHTIDPRTGRPVTHRLGSVTVVADNCETADALATALMVLGPEAGYNWAAEQGTCALFLTRGEGDRVSERASPAFEQWLKTSATRPTEANHDTRSKKDRIAA